MDYFINYLDFPFISLWYFSISLTGQISGVIPSHHSGSPLGSSFVELDPPDCSSVLAFVKVDHSSWLLSVFVKLESKDCSCRNGQ